MTYRFRSQAWGDVLVLQPVGDELLAAMGLAPAPRGLIAPEAIAGVRAALQAAIEPRDPHGFGPTPLEEVTLRQRAWPLIQMLDAAAAQHEAVVWGV